jgi:hypothetical protein
LENVKFLVRKDFFMAPVDAASPSFNTTKSALPTTASADNATTPATPAPSPFEGNNTAAAGDNFQANNQGNNNSTPPAGPNITVNQINIGKDGNNATGQATPANTAEAAPAQPATAAAEPEKKGKKGCCAGKKGAGQAAKEGDKKAASNPGSATGAANPTAPPATSQGGNSNDLSNLQYTNLGELFGGSTTAQPSEAVVSSAMPELTNPLNDTTPLPTAQNSITPVEQKTNSTSQGVPNITVNQVNA